MIKRAALNKQAKNIDKILVLLGDKPHVVWDFKTSEKQVKFRMAIEIPKQRLTFRTLSVDCFHDMLLRPIDADNFSLDVSYQAFERLRAQSGGKAAIILGHQKAKKMLKHFLENRQYVFIAVEGLNLRRDEKINKMVEFMLKLAIFMSEMIVTLAGCTFGDELRENIIALKKSSSIARQKTLLPNHCESCVLL